MAYFTGTLFLNITDTKNPVEHISVIESFCDEDFDLAYQQHNYSLPDYNSSVVAREIDIFGEYHHIYLLINAFDFYTAESILIKWTTEYINDVMKGIWLDEQLKDLPIYSVSITRKNGGYDILGIYEVFSKPYDLLKDSLVLIMSEGYRYIPTELSHICSAWKVPTNATLFIDAWENLEVADYELIICAKDREEAREVAHDFIRLYLEDNEHRSPDNVELEQSC